MAITSFPNWHTLDLAQTLAESVDENRHESELPGISPLDHNDHDTPESLDIPHKPRGDKSLAEIQSWSGGNPGNPDLQGYTGQPGGIPELEGRNRESRESTQDGLTFPDFHGTQTNPDINGYNSQELERQNVGLPEFNSGEKGSVPSYALPDAPGSIEAPGWQSTATQPPIDVPGWQGGAGSEGQEVSNWRGEVELPSPLAFPEFQPFPSAQVEISDRESPGERVDLDFPQFQSPQAFGDVGSYESNPFFSYPAGPVGAIRTDDTFWFA